MSIDERLEALTMSLELLSRDHEEERAKTKAQGLAIDKLTQLIQIDAENIRSLAKIAESHEARMDRIEGH